MWDCVEDGKALLRSCCLCVEEGKALLRQWGIPEHYRGIGCCILGYADEAPAPKERAANRILKI
mgnify:CR=1 FL=1